MTLKSIEVGDKFTPPQQGLNTDNNIFESKKRPDVLIKKIKDYKPAHTKKQGIFDEYFKEFTPDYRLVFEGSNKQDLTAYYIIEKITPVKVTKRDKENLMKKLNYFFNKCLDFYRDTYNEKTKTGLSLDLGKDHIMYGITKKDMVPNLYFIDYYPISENRDIDWFLTELVGALRMLVDKYSLDWGEFEDLQKRVFNFTENLNQ